MLTGCCAAGRSLDRCTCSPAVGWRHERLHPPAVRHPLRPRARHAALAARGARGLRPRRARPGGGPAGGGRPLRGPGVRAHQRRGRPAGLTPGRRRGGDARLVPARLPAVRRGRLGGRAAPAGVRWRRLPADGRQRRQGDAHQRQHGVLAVSAADHRGGLPARAPRHRRAAAHLRAQDGLGGVDRHDVPHRAAGGLRRRRGDHEGGAGRRRHLPDHRAEDLHHLRRPRPGRQHHPPGARPAARRSARHQGHLAVPGAQGAGERGRQPRGAQRRRGDRARAQDGHPRLADLHDGLRRGRRRRHRLPRRGAPPRHAGDVHDDERRPAGRGPAGPGDRRARLPAVAATRASAPRAAHRRQPRASSRRSSSTPTCAGCC
jgi:hypothetical protein